MVRVPPDPTLAPARATLGSDQGRRYEFVVSSHHKVFFFHPYFFAVILAVSSVMSLVENSVFDYDNITFEIWKSHMVSCIYFAVYWYTAKADHKDNPSMDFKNREQEEAILVAIALAFLSLVTTALAPYTSVAYTNYMLWLPITITLGAFFDVLYVSQHNGKVDTDSQDAKRPFKFTEFWVSFFFIIVKAVVVIYYWRDYSTILHAVYENNPTRSIQYNQSCTWLTPSF